MNEKDYGTLPIRRLFIKCTVPSMVGMGFAAVYSVVDGIFVGRYIGGEALAAAVKEVSGLKTLCVSSQTGAGVVELDEEINRRLAER